MTAIKYSVSLSFLFCTLNREEDLRRSLSAIFGNSNNSVITFDVVVVDQGQSHYARKVCDGFNVKYFSSPTRGLSIARNIGLEYCDGDFVALMDDDAYVSESYFHRIKGLLESCNNTEIAAFSGRIMTIEKPLEPLSRYQGAQPTSVNLKNIDTVLSSALVIRKSIFAMVGNFDEEFGVGAKWGASEETDFLVRILNKNYSVEYYPSLTVFHPMANFDVMGYGDIYRKTYAYGQGRGALISKHKSLPNRLVISAFLIPLAAAMASLIIFRPKHALRYMSSFLGRVSGLLKYELKDKKAG